MLRYICGAKELAGTEEGFQSLSLRDKSSVDGSSFLHSLISFAVDSRWGPSRR